MYDDGENIGSNPTANPSLTDIVDRRLDRRQVLHGGLTALALGFFGGATGLLGTGTAVAAPKGGPEGGPKGAGPLLGFVAVPVSEADTFVVPAGYTAQVLIPWGTPLFSRGPAWKKDASNTAAEQAQQLGNHHDGMHFFPLGKGPQAGKSPEASRRGLLVVNHEYIDRTLHYTDGDTPTAMTTEKVDKALAAHGVTVIEVAENRGTWRQRDNRANRRITGTTPVAFSGPVSLDRAEMTSNNAPMGTLNNCSHGYTPWGTYLTCEENFNGYFGTDDESWTPDEDQARYGISSTGFGYNWHRADPRFDVAVNPNELNRFGWVVEIDPFDPRSTPVKRTALGRYKHEGATVTEAKGHVVVYSGDDENQDYVYKFVGSERWDRVRKSGRSPLDVGTLYVATFDDDGTGTWLPLVHGQGPLTTGNGFADQGDVMLRTRQAADAVGATKLARPEWVAVDERTKDVYLTLTNGDNNSGEVNPRDPNPYGSVVRWQEAGGDNRALTFGWEIFLLAGDPTVDPTTTVPDEDRFGSPDGIWADPDGRIWIQTDISNGSQRAGGYRRVGNNMMLVADPATREVRRFLTGPNGCEITGCITTPDQRTMFVNVQHPGEATTTIGRPTPQNPRAVSSWPDFDAAGRPRSATVVITKDDAGVIGT